MCAAASHAGLKVSYVLKRGGKVSQITLHLDGKHARMDVAEEGVQKGAVIVGPADERDHEGPGPRVTFFHHDGKNCPYVTDSQVQRMNTLFEQTRAKLAAMPPAERKQAEAEIARNEHRTTLRLEGLKPDEQYVRTSGSKEIAGRRCDLYRVELAGAHVADTCLIPWDEVKSGRDQLRQGLGAVQRAMVTEIVHRGVATFGAAPKMRAWSTAIGLPAWRKEVKEGSDLTETTLVSIATAAVPKETFMPPAGCSGGKIWDPEDAADR
jgi:hypothetical protein